MANRTLILPVTELDFDQIKENLKAFLSTSDEFKDYDFEGSGINALLDLLAYNTHYTAIYANMLASEAFIDSAVLRRSLVSLAKNLGYVPNSRRAATAEVDVVFGTTAGVPSTVPQGTKFFALKDGQNYTFSTTEPYLIDKTEVPYKVEDMEIRQGVYKSVSFVYDSSSNSTKFEIPSSNIDKDLIQVYVMASPSDLGSVDLNWKENTNYIELTPTSKVYFINENFRGNYQVSFGDGIVGAKPDERSYIVVVYFETEGSNANDIGNRDTETLSSFSFGGINGSDFDSTVITVTPSFGGAERDTTEKIRYAATKYYQAQDRAVTMNDYESIVLREYPLAEAVRVWGGEDNDPPAYGKVYVSVLPKNKLTLSNGDKESIKSSILENKKVVGITTEIVDPDYTYVEVDCFATYNSNATTSSELNVKDAILKAIKDYNTASLGRFSIPFRYSNLSRGIDLSSNAMVSNRVTTRLSKKIIPVERSANYTLNFNVPLFHPHDGHISIVKTSVFKHRDSENKIRDCFIEDNGSGRLVVYTILNEKKVVVKANAGTIDYQTGKVEIIGLNPTSTGTLPYIRFTVSPDQRFDIVPKRNQVLLIDNTFPGSINITMSDAAIRNI